MLKLPRIFLKKKFNNKFPLINVGTSKNISIKKLSFIVGNTIKFNGKIIFDKKYPDGTYKKNLDSSIIRKLNWKPEVNLKEGLKRTLADFKLKFNVKY